MEHAWPDIAPSRILVRQGLSAAIASRWAASDRPRCSRLPRCQTYATMPSTRHVQMQPHAAREAGRQAPSQRPCELHCDPQIHLAASRRGPFAVAGQHSPPAADRAPIQCQRVQHIVRRQRWPPGRPIVEAKLGATAQLHTAPHAAHNSAEMGRPQASGDCHLQSNQRDCTPTDAAQHHVCQGSAAASRPLQLWIELWIDLRHVLLDLLQSTRLLCKMGSPHKCSADSGAPHDQPGSKSSTNDRGCRRAACCTCSTSTRRTESTEAPKARGTAASLARAASQCTARIVATRP